MCAEDCVKGDPAGETIGKMDNRTALGEDGQVTVLPDLVAERHPLPSRVRIGRVVGILAVSGAAHLYASASGLGHDPEYIPLQRTLAAGALATVWSALLSVVLWSRPMLLRLPLLGVLLKVDLFCGIWIGAIPIGFVLGAHLPSAFYANVGAAYLLVPIHMMGLVAGPALGLVVLRSLRV